jgi:hypothetical protein
MKLDNVSVVIGIDWADRTHVCCLFDRGGAVKRNVRVGSSAEEFSAWLDEVSLDYPQGTILIALEKTEGAMVEMIQNRARFGLVPVNPVVLHRIRQAFSPSGAKNDPGDAWLLGEIVFTHPERFEVKQLSEGILQSLSHLVAQRRHWVNTRTRFVEELTSCLKKFYPQALELAGGNLASPMAVEFLQRWPDLNAVKKARWSTLESFYRKHHSGREDLLKQRAELLQIARSVSEREAYLKPHRMHMLAILGQLSAVNKSVEEFDEAIAEVYANAPGHEVIDSLPGAGKALAPRLWVACADQAGTANAQTLQVRSGIAPVKRQSGNSTVVSFRWARPRFLHQTWTEFARCSLKTSTWAQAFHEDRKTRGDAEPAILRALAFKWIRIVARIWVDKVPYDEAYYIEHCSIRRASA